MSLKVVVASVFLQLFVFLHLNGQDILGYAPYYRTFSAETDFSLYSHIHFFTVWPDSSGGLLWPDYQDSISIHQKYSQIYKQMEHSDQKLLITFGGTSEGGSLYFSRMAGDSATLENFCLNAINLCKAWDADGLDIDWEWGKRLDQDQEEERAAYEKLMTRLRTLADQENLLLSTAVSASSWFGDNYSVQGVDQAHYINVMTYTYNGAWSSTANHHSPLSKSENIGLSYWKGKGISPAKLNLGVPFYGVKYQGASLPGDSFTSVSALTYEEVKDHISQGFQVVEDLENGSYCHSASSIIFYNPPAELAHKVQFVKEHSYPGIFIWEIGQDDIEQTLSRAMYNSMHGPGLSLSAYLASDHGYSIHMEPGAGITVSSLSDDIFSIYLYGLDGREIAARTDNRLKALLYPGHISSGVYVLIIRSRNSFYYHKILLNE